MIENNQFPKNVVAIKSIAITNETIKVDLHCVEDKGTADRHYSAIFQQIVELNFEKDSFDERSLGVDVDDINMSLNGEIKCITFNCSTFTLTIAFRDLMIKPLL